MTQKWIATENDEKNTQRRGTYGVGVVATVRGWEGPLSLQGEYTACLLQLLQDGHEGYLCPEKNQRWALAHSTPSKRPLHPWR